MNMFEIKDGAFMLNGKPFQIYSGAIHYFRVLPEYWRDRLEKLKAAGFNTVETYVCWNLHEPKKGEFDFTGRLDIERYIKTAQELGLYVIIRPGPYICAEWDFGGLPAWLLKDKNMRLRCNDPVFLQHVSDFYAELFRRLAPLQITRGGNIIAMQVENEYGSYGNDKKYLNRIHEIILKNGAEVLLFTADGTSPSMLAGGGIDGVYKTLNFGSRAASAFKSLRGIQDNAPKMCMEFWCGWFDHWGEKHHTRGYQSILHELESFFDQGAGFNFYMFHGGTNFGFTAGANYAKYYQPTTTSYDYCAPLNEYGGYTPQYHAIRKLMHEKRGLPLGELPPEPKLQSIGKVELTEKTGLFENMDLIGEQHYSPMPESMEYYGQNFGLIYYKTTVHGAYGMCSMMLRDLHDRAYVYVDGELKKTFDVMKPDGLIKRIMKKDGLLLNLKNEETELGILVDAMGRVNYGEHLMDRKGISAVNLNLQTVMDYEVTTLPLDNIEKLDFTRGAAKYPIFFRGKFKANSQAESFVRLDGFTKGAVYVNGFNLGRYWKKGPQKTLYLPGVLLKEENEIVVLELEHCDKPVVEITDRHDLG